MKTVVREVASLVIGLSGVVLCGRGMNFVLDTGTCGGRYARPCPENATAWFWALVAGVLMLIAGIILSKNAFMQPGAGQVVWVAAFAGGGVALLIKVLTDEEMPPDARLGASIVAATFIPMGLAVAIVGIAQLILRRHRRRRAKPAPAKQQASTPWSRMKAINDLRSVGALTRAEFDGLKADLDDADKRVAQIRELADQKAAGALSEDEFEARKRDLLQSRRV